MSSVSGDRPRGLFRLAGAALLELMAWRTLTYQLVRAELTRENARLSLGALWWIADPLLQMLVYTILVGVIFARSQPDYPLFILAALIPWKGVASSVSTAGTAVIGNERIVRQVAFPRVVLPVARLLAEMWRLGIALIVMVTLLFLIWPDRVSPALLWLPVLAVIQAVFLAPFVIALSAATVFVRDLANLMRHVIRLGMYLSPVLYGLDQVLPRLPEAAAVAYGYNPIALLLEAYREVAYHGRSPNVGSMVLPLIVGLALLPFAMAWFRSLESRFGKAL